MREIAPLDSSRFRQYSPMTMTLVVVVLLAVALLPSALNIPQSNPNTVPEYAPVPPDEESQTTEQGNLAALGQARGSSLSRSGGLQAEPISAAAAQKRSAKKCVGNPARQTEDPMSPPCVPFFEGDNGGATFQGVTGNEVTVVIYFDAGATYNVGDGLEQSPPAGVCDPDRPPNSDPACRSPQTGQDHAFVRFTRAFNRYFNSRYQTYERRVRYWIYWGIGGTVEQKNSNAADIYQRFKPFATLDQTTFTGNDQAYLEAMARRRVMLFPDPIYGGTGDVQPDSYYNRYAPQVFGFFPDVPHWVELHASYLCSRVAGFPVTHAQGGRMSDGSEMNGRARRYGFLSANTSSKPGLKLFADLIRPKLRECGITPEPGADRTSSYNNGNGPWTSSDAQQETTLNVAAWRQADVSTVLRLGGMMVNHSHTMSQAKYFPEFVFAGSLDQDDNAGARFHDQQVWANAWGTTWQLRADRLDNDQGFQACTEGDPFLSRGKCDNARLYYRSHFMLFRAIQAAGPRLTPTAVDRGLHAFPRISSSSPYVAACFFDPGDYTCVKDSAEIWWDPAAQAETNTAKGCYRLTNGGPRFRAGDWPRESPAFNPQQDPCSDITFGGIFR